MNETSNQLLPLLLSRLDSSGTLSSAIRTLVEGEEEEEEEEERGRVGQARVVSWESAGDVSPHQLTVVPLSASPQEGPPSEDQSHLQENGCTAQNQQQQ